MLSEEQYKQLLGFLAKNGEDLGDDDKDVVYYIFPDKLLKAVHNISKGNAKISLKMNKIGDGSVFPETEIHFPKEDFEKLKFILDKIVNPTLIMEGIQKRKNFVYKDCEFAVKWSKEWGFHFEIEKVVASKDLVKEAERQLDMVSKELGIKVLTEQELKDFTTKTEENAKKF